MIDAAFALARLGLGARPGEAAGLDPRHWLEAQLAPPPGDDPGVAARLDRARLKIKYNEGDSAKNQKWAAMDEMRPLTTLAQPIDQLWPLFDKEQHDGAERRRPLLEVMAATLIRAAHSDYPLRERMVGFWHDHFNVDAWDQEQVAVALPTYDRDVIRRHALGNFRQFLEAVASSTAMLYYLSNRSSRAGSANENYARELFELHTLGRDAYLNDKYDRWREVPGALDGKPAGYIDQDVYEAARALTGWTVEDGSGIDGHRKLPSTGRFAYVDVWHDGYQKRVLATEFDAFQPAQADGRKVLDLVAHHPATARFICTKLVRRLAADDPPPALVQKAVAAWTKYRDAPDQIARTLRAIATAPEFAASRGRKLRRPVELVVAFVRATGMELTPTEPLFNELANAGQRLYGYPAPTGLADQAEAFLGANAMRRRWLILLALADNNWGTGSIDPPPPLMAATPRQAASFWLQAMLGGADPADTEAIAVAIGQPDQPIGPPGAPDTRKRLARAAAFAAMSPGFQSC
ncbi:MAG TPA: DUF1800 domain-containing protein [Aliidongia sp.]|nr:DUF1800 domain-containing protein [Aliidongia sp.]